MRSSKLEINTRKHLAKIEQGVPLSYNSVALEELHQLIKSKRFLRNGWFQEWQKKASSECPHGFVEHLRFFSLVVLLINIRAWKKYRAIKHVLGNNSRFREIANDYIIEMIVRDNANYFDSVEQNPLTDKQREAAASDEDATLVIAGAGTGKTSTIVAKIGLLVKTGQCTPDEILAISFTKKSAEELEQRVKERLSIDVSVSTFHKLGLSILSQSEGYKPTLAPFSSDKFEKIKFIKSLIDSLKADEKFNHRLIKFLAYYRIQNKEIWNFSSLSEYTEWIRSNKIFSLDGKSKKSYQECVIANWLLLNGVAFEYEPQYEHLTRTMEHRQYCPDFYLPDAKIYIEHFGVNLDGTTAPHVDKEEYWQGIEWKREIHQRHRTTLIETYSWEHSRGVWEKNLSQWLSVNGCVLNPIPIEKALELINESGVINGFVELVSNFLTLYKGNGNILFESSREEAPLHREREQTFLELFYRIFKEYESINLLSNQIDFEDMITRATKLVENSSYLSRFNYILVDEFQDISPGRANLLRALQRSKKDSALFAVGDDWQSIYRFAGSDIGAMTKFEQIFGLARMVSLDKTFRFDEETLQVSSTFVQKNGAQLRKQLKSDRSSNEPSVIIYRNKSGEEKPWDWCLEQISNEAKTGASVLILERYKRHLPAGDDATDARFDEDSDWARLQKQFPNLSLTNESRKTIHTAKGLEADYVIVGLKGGLWGFPNQAVDDPLFDLVLTQADLFPFGEERRLFYVALTRSRNKTYIVYEAGVDQSVFAKELESGAEYLVSVFGEDIEKTSCAKCISGVMLLRNGSNGNFYGCSNFPLCSNTENACANCGKGYMVKNGVSFYECNVCEIRVKICPRCQTGVLKIKNGVFGEFYGCTNYKGNEVDCRYTENISPTV